MKKWLGRFGASLAIGVLGLAVIALVQPAPVRAITQAVLKVRSSPAGVNLPNPVCYTLQSGACGTTDWISKNSGGIPSTTYKYPVVTTIGGSSYTLNANSLTGCNQGMAGSKPNICKVSVPGGSVATIDASYSPTPPPPPWSACTNNLVQNHSFETVVPNPVNSSSQWGAWPAWQIGNSTPPVVPYWSQENPAGLWMFDLNTTSPSWQYNQAFDGSRVAVMIGVKAGFPVNGAVNSLSAPTISGTVYDVSAEVGTVLYPGSTTYDLRLRNSSTGALSTPVTQTVGQQTGQWTLLHGTITANASYDQVLVRYNGPLVDYHDYIGLVDDVHVCQVGGGTHWWQVGGGIVFVLTGLAGGAMTWRTRRSENRPTATGGSRGAPIGVGDFDGDGRAGKTHGTDGRLGTNTRLAIAGGLVIVGTVAIYIGATHGGEFKTNSPNKSGTMTLTDTSTAGCLNKKYLRELSYSVICDANGKTIQIKHMSAKSKSKPISAKTPLTTETCVDKESAKEGYKLFHNTTYKYCVLYPISWPTDSRDSAKVTFGTMPAAEPDPGWLKVTHFTKKTVAKRIDEVLASFKEPAGPCKQSSTTLASEAAIKLDCTGAANGEDHVYVLLGHGQDLYELSYIGDLSTATGKTSYGDQYKVILDSLKF